jgi:hypothetical protein
MSTTKLKLAEPIKHGSEIIAELEFVQPKAKHLRKMPAAPATGDLLDLAGALCGQPPSVIGELGIPDMMAVLEVVGNFMEPGPKTGEKD